MASYNRVILMGNFTRDVELRRLQTGTAVADIGLAVNDRRKSAQGEWIEETTFVDVTLWGRTAEIASEFLGKGSSVLIEGRLKLDSWETDGQKRSKLKVVCERLQMLGSRGGGSGSVPRSDSAGNEAMESSSPYHDDEEHAVSVPSGTPKDDIPF